MSSQGPNEVQKKKTRPSFGLIKAMSTASSIGLSLVIAIVLGFVTGWWLDSRLGTKPWLTLIGLLMGIAAGFKNVFILTERLEREAKSNDEDDGK
ncbi:MAG: AtpZ/AtpI family protein [Deltaproteobacteria bacterium]|jgi:ATP synthase protein I|nr:AtpZ/AtpI family protein [Deltaproteobacteria bacterium]